MFIDTKTKERFTTLKEAKQVLGLAQFNRLAKAHQIIIIPTNKNLSAQNYEQLHTDPE